MGMAMSQELAAWERAAEASRTFSAAVLRALAMSTMFVVGASLAAIRRAARPWPTRC